MVGEVDNDPAQSSYVAALTADEVDGGPTPVLLRFADDGSVVWQRRLPGMGLLASRVLSDGGVAVVVREDAGTDMDARRRYRMALLRVAPDGSSAWRTEDDASEWREGESAPNCMLAPLPGGALLAAHQWQGDPRRLFLDALDAEGSPLWSGELRDAWLLRTWPSLLGDRGVLLAWTILNRGPWLALLTSDGAIGWQRTVVRGTLEQQAWGTAVSRDGGVLFVGGSAWGSGYDYWTLKFGPDGEFGSACANLACPDLAIEPVPPRRRTAAAEPPAAADIPLHVWHADVLAESLAWSGWRGCPGE